MIRLSKILLGLGLLATQLLRAGESSTPAASAQQHGPNIVIIMVDDMGYGGVSCFDNQYFTTPEIDKLCADGMKLTDFHSNGSVCSPTRAALMTGRYQQRSGCDKVVNADPAVAMHHVGIHDREWTFPEAMQSAGYATGIFGKWHLGYKPEFHPMNHGFDEFIGFISGNIDAQSHMDRMGVQDWWQGYELKDEPAYHTDLINQHALDFIDRHQAEPFFLYVAHGAPHSPHQARASAITRGPKRGQVPDWAPNESYSDDPDSEDWLIRNFILPVDEGVGQIRDKLEALGLADRTIVWFISDNGGTRGNQTMSAQTKGSKGTFYEGGHRVPGIVWAPGRVPAGAVSDELILAFDIMPTMLAQAGVDLPAGHQLDGVNVERAIIKNEALPPMKRFWNMGNRGALRDGNWKLVVNGSKSELYDLDQDSREQNDLAAQYPERVSEMRKFYDSTLSETTADSPYIQFLQSMEPAKAKKQKKAKHAAKADASV